MTDHPLPEQTKIEKINSEPGDGHPNGTRGRVILLAYAKPVMSPDLPSSLGPQWGYFVEWEPLPGIPVFTIGNKLKAAP